MGIGLLFTSNLLQREVKHTPWVNQLMLDKCLTWLDLYMWVWDWTFNLIDQFTSATSEILCHTAKNLRTGASSSNPSTPNCKK
jgi:hypothetical protein